MSLSARRSGICWNRLRLTVMVAAIAVSSPTAGEYGDVVLNKRSESEGVRPVVFPHWFHRIRFQCRVCHTQLGFKMKAGANDISMLGISDGKFCGACHNGEIAWSVENCDLCHSGRPGLKAGVQGGHRTGGPGRW